MTTNWAKTPEQLDQAIKTVNEMARLVKLQKFLDAFDAWQATIELEQYGQLAWDQAKYEVMVIARNAMRTE